MSFAAGLRRTGWLAPLLLAACGPTSDDAAIDDTDFEVPEGAVDERVDFPETMWEGALVYESAPMIIPPATDQMFCLYLKYDGATVGMHQLHTAQSKYGHHFVVAGTSASERDIPTGTVVDCTSSEALGMENFEPLMVGGTPEPGGQSYTFTLPDGMAARLEGGQRIVLQSHYLNTTSKPIVVQDQIQIGVMPEDDVTMWTAPWIHTNSDFVLQTGESSRTVACTWEQDTTLLFLGGHMHEWGSKIDIAVTPDGGEPTTLYDIPDWDPVMRDQAPLNDYTTTPFQVHAGDTFRTTCTWNNDTGAPLGFPHEMCVAFGMRYPAQSPSICDDPG